MSAATTSQRLVTRDGRKFSFPSAATIKLLAGVLLALDGSNNLVNASDAAARRIVGWSDDEVDNLLGAAGDLRANVNVGQVLLVNSGTHALTNAHIGQVCFAEDNQTVGSDPGTYAVVAGRVVSVDADGVWVAVGIGHAPIPLAVTALAAATATDGTAAAASASLANLAAEAEKIGDDGRATQATLASLITALQAQGFIK